ncbi:MAG TPA: sulfite exporter TauE/SafE family protein [Solirubrobacteraceae bacterium]|nr:sulfite exporter TauE/SafE family protein [Solirubrobacteraceae bacterium]
MAGVLAGLVGSAGGITSLVSYPALLAVGLPARAANLANNVALVACWPGSALTSQPELRDRWRWLRRWSVVTAAGAAVGSGLLLATPARVFAHIVPFLIAGGSLVLLFEPRLTAWRRRHSAPEGQLGWGFALPLFAFAFYNGYFGAGAGVMTLTLVLVMVDHHLPTANALKNMLIGASQLASVVILASSGSVRWGAVAPLAAGMLVGASLGPLVARRVPAPVMRVVVSLLGLGLAVRLWVG